MGNLCGGPSGPDGSDWQLEVMNISTSLERENEMIVFG